VVLAIVWPLVSDWLVEALGVRALATALLLVSAGSLTAARSAVPSDLAPDRVDSAALLGLVGAAALSGERLFLLLVPAWVQVALFRVFRRSASNGGSVFERVAFAIQPYAPEFIRPYCRKSTALWSWLFLANALAIAALALFAPIQLWRAFSSWIVWAVMLALGAIDFVARKLYFRIYRDGPLDRVLARWFPAANTAMGRRCNEYVRAKRLALGRPPWR